MKTIAFALLALTTVSFAVAQDIEPLHEDDEVVVIRERTITIPEIRIDIPDFQESIERMHEEMRTMHDRVREQMQRIPFEHLDAVHAQLNEVWRWEDWTYAQADTAGRYREIDETKACDPDAEIFIRNITGFVKVIAWDRAETRVTGTLGQDVERLEFEADGDDVEIRVIVPRNTRNARVRSELTVYVPEQAQLEVDTVSAPIEVRGLRGARHELHTVSAGIEVLDSNGAFEVHTVSGTIKHEEARGPVRAETVSGSITLGGAPENVEIETVSGQVRVSGARGKVMAESVSGSLRIDGQDVEDAEFSTVSGGIKFYGNLRSGGDLYAKAISGGIEIRLDDVAGRYDLQTFSGSIRNAFGPKLESNRRGPGRELRFSEGGDSRRIVAETFSGSISIDKN